MKTKKVKEVFERVKLSYKLTEEIPQMREEKIGNLLMKRQSEKELIVCYRMARQLGVKV